MQLSFQSDVNVEAFSTVETRRSFKVKGCRFSLIHLSLTAKASFTLRGWKLKALTSDCRAQAAGWRFRTRRMIPHPVQTDWCQYQSDQQPVRPEQESDRAERYLWRRGSTNSNKGVTAKSLLQQRPCELCLITGHRLREEHRRRQTNTCTAESFPAVKNSWWGDGLQILIVWF